MASESAVEAVVERILREQPDESPEDWEYVAQLAVEAIRSLPIGQRTEAMGMNCIGHMSASGTVWMGKGDQDDRLTVFADNEAAEEFVRG